MDIVRQITLVYPVETFVFGADWLLQRATQTPAPDAKSKSIGAWRLRIFPGNYVFTECGETLINCIVQSHKINCGSK